MTTWTRTGRLELRLPTMADLPAYIALHTDPRTYTHAPSSMPSPQECAARLEANVRAWEVDGIGYCAVLERATGRLVGWGGVRRDVVEQAGVGEHLNLYFRLEHDAAGRGLGRELARAVVARATQDRPELPVTAVARSVNAASLATCHRAGLVRTGTWYHPEDDRNAEPSVLLAAPRLASITGVVGPEAREEMLRMWLRVNDAGGSVGFLPGAAETAVSEALERHLDRVARGAETLVTLREPDGRLVAMGFWRRDEFALAGHTATLKRLMVEPAEQGRNLGRILLDGMVGVARRELPGVELLRLAYRSGHGLGDFYARAGWQEVGRIPRSLRVGEGDERDSVEMARRVDGAPLDPDGRT